MSCGFSIYGNSGDKLIGKMDASGLRQCEFEAEISALGKLSFQDLQITVLNKKTVKLNNDDHIKMEIFAEVLDSSTPIKLINFNTSKSEFEMFELKKGDESLVVIESYKPSEGVAYETIKISNIKYRAAKVRFSVNFSKPLPEGTIVKCQLFWADGP